MTDEDEGPRTVHLNPAELPGGERFRAPVIPVVEARPQPPVTVEPSASDQATRAVRVPDQLTQALSAPAPTPSARPTPALPTETRPAAGEPLGPRPPVMRQAQADRTAVYTSAPRPAGKATVPAPSPRAAGAAQVSAPVSAAPAPPQRPAWTVEPGWSAYPQQTPQQQTPGGGSAPGQHGPSPLAGALLGTENAPAKTSSGKRTALTIVAVIVIAALVGGGVAWFFGDDIGTLISKVTG